MNFSEFKELLGADPYSQDPAFLRARHQGGEFTEAATEADAFEQKLQQALAAPAPEGLAESIIGHVQQKPGHRIRTWQWAAAAGLFMALGAALVVNYQRYQFGSVEEYVLQHWQHDGVAIELQAAAPVSSERIRSVLTAVGASADEAIGGKIHYIKKCPTPDGKGAHMVVMTDSGPVTVIYMPKMDLDKAKHMSLESKQAYLIVMDRGSAALIGNSQADLQALEPMVRKHIKPVDELKT